MRSDFGAVARANPVDKSLEIGRKVAVHQLVLEATELASVGGRLIVTGPPGHGKSWTCQQLLNALSGEGWLTAEHYCYLGNADEERKERVLEEAISEALSED